MNKVRPKYLHIEREDNGIAEILLHDIPWVSATESRYECFMAHGGPMTYTYGVGKGERTYASVPPTPFISAVFDTFQELGYDFNVCFLNRYDSEKQALGWHSDDSPGMSHDHPIAVVSYGQPREIWWREIGQKGVIPAEQRRLLENGSVFIMPAGFQRTHQHRIPKGDRDMGLRISLTLRHYDIGN